MIISDPGQSLALHNVWRYNYNTLPKPCFHPLNTPAGHCLSLYEPHDHLWQRGLWFAIKFVNGDNYWEERPPFGTQQVLDPLTITQDWAGRVRVESDLHWLPPGSQEPVVHERRIFSHHPLSDDAYALDFEFELVPQIDVELERTPFTTWGGYGGLAFRGTRNWEETCLLFADGSTSTRPVGVRAPWCDLSGKLDGGLEQTGGIALFDHPTNPRHPVPWYGNNRPGYYFLNAAILFEEPMVLAAGATLALRYRVVVHDGIWSAEQIQAAYDAYVSG